MSDEEDYVFVPSPASEILSLPPLSESAVSSRTPTPPLRPTPRTIHDLEDSLLTRIFLVLAYIHRPFVGYDRDHYDLGFILGSHVCRRWRAIIVSCPEIWVRDVFTFPNQHAVLTIIERTQDLPLDVRLTFAHPWLAWRLSLCFNLLPRMRSLKLSAMYGGISRVGFHDLLVSIIAQGAPLLESLDISQLGILIEDQPLNLEFFAPNLRSLRLGGIFFPCLSTALNFVHLKIARPTREADDIVNVLRGSPDTLEHILFDIVPNTIAAARSARNAFRHEVFLPSAKVVALRGSDAALLELLHVPPETFFCLSLTAAFEPVEEVADNIFLIRARAALSSRSPCAISLDAAQDPVRLAILSSPEGKMQPPGQALTLATHALETARGLYDCMSSGSDLPDHSVDSGLLIEWHGRTVPASEEWMGGNQLRALLDLIRFAIESGEGDLFQAVKCLDICVPDDLLAAEWAHLLKCYTAVDTLRMHIASGTLLATLATQTSTLLPNLTTLVVVLDNMDDTKDYRDHQQSRLSMKRLTDLVIAHLEAGRDSSIELVRLEGNSMSRVFAEAVKERLSAYVPHVELELE